MSTRARPPAFDASAAQRSALDELAELHGGELEVTYTRAQRVGVIMHLRGADGASLAVLEDGRVTA